MMDSVGIPGQRHDLEGEDLNLGSGEYGKDPDGVWWVRVPQLEENETYPFGFHSGVSNLNSHEVVEHNDGTITVSPSIRVTGHHSQEWHGTLEKGIWKEI